MAQGGSVPDLIWPVGYGSDGQGSLGARAAALLAGALLRGGKLVGEGQNGAPVVTSSRVLVVGQARGTRKPLGCSGEGIGTRDAVRGGDGGRTRRGIAGASSRGLWGALQAKAASAKVRRGLGGAHRALD